MFQLLEAAPRLWVCTSSLRIRHNRSLDLSERREMEENDRWRRFTSRYLKLAIGLSTASDRGGCRDLCR